MFKANGEYREVFKSAWQLAVLSRYRKLLLYAFIPALFTTTLSTAIYSLRGYQYWTEIFTGGDFANALMYGIQTFFGYLGENPGVAVLLFLFGFIFTLGYICLPLLANGALIKLIPMIIKQEEFKFRTGIVFSGQYFLKLLELRALFSPFRFSWIALSYWLLHVFNPTALQFFAIPLVIWLTVDIFANLLFLFSEYFIVIKGQNVFESVGSSFHMVFMNIERVASMLYLSFIISTRIILNTILVFGIPMAVLVFGGYLASNISTTLALGIGIILGIGTILLLSYIISIVQVFVVSSKTLIFLKFDKEMTKEEPKAETVSEETLINIAKAHEALLMLSMNSAAANLQQNKMTDINQVQEQQHTSIITPPPVGERKTLEIDMEVEKEMEHLMQG